LVDHVITSPSGNGDEFDLLGAESDLGEVGGNFGFDFFESGLAVVDRFVVHFVHGNDDLFDSERESEEGVFASLTVLGNTGLKSTRITGNNEDGDIGLGGTRDHVFDEISVAGGIDNGEGVFGGFKLPEGDIDGDTTLSFGF
jgi:hypothetical protein